MLGWLVGIIYEIINVTVGVYAAVAIFDELGWANSGDPGLVVALIVVYGLCICLPLLGHATMMFVQRFFSVALGIAVLLLFVSLVDNLDLGARAGEPLSGKATLQAVLIAIGIAWAGGSISNNALTLYSAGLAAQAAGLPLKRWQATMVDGLIAIAGLVYVLFVDNGNFFANLNSYIVLAIAWVGPFGAVYLLDLWWRTWHVRPEHAHGDNSSPFAGLSGPRRSAWIATIAGIGAALLTIASPKFNGPIAKALGTDLVTGPGPADAAAGQRDLGYHALAPLPSELCPNHLRNEGGDPNRVRNSSRRRWQSFVERVWRQRRSMMSPPLSASAQPVCCITSARDRCCCWRRCASRTNDGQPRSTPVGSVKDRIESTQWSSCCSIPARS